MRLVAMFSVEEYKYAFSVLGRQITDKQWAMLRAHYAAPDKSVTTHQLANYVGEENYSFANRWYPEVGKMLSSCIGRHPEVRRNVKCPYWRVISGEGNHREAGGFVWTMHPQVAQALEELGIVDAVETVLPEEVSAEIVYREGAVRQVTVNAYERNSRARRECIAHYGAQCAACGFSFGATYGEVGADYIHVHHLRQLADIGEQYEVNPIEDLRPVCANCHAIIHRRTPPHSVEEIQAMLNRCAPSSAMF